MPDAPDLYPGLLLEVSDAGAVRWSGRQLPTTGFVVGAVVGTAAVAALLALLGGAGAAVGALGLAAFLLVLVLASALERHEVREHALVVTVPGSRSAPYVVPWATVDASLVRLHERANLLGRRTGVQPRASVRVSPWTRTAVSFPGLGADYASPARRRGRLQDVRAMLGRGQPLMPLPLEPWVVAARDPAALLGALEAALVAAGQVQARGLAQRCLDAPVRERYRTPLTEEQVYGHPLPRRLPVHDGHEG